jgi:hypothetical protein
MIRTPETELSDAMINTLYEGEKLNRGRNDTPLCNSHYALFSLANPFSVISL